MLLFCFSSLSKYISAFATQAPVWLLHKIKFHIPFWCENNRVILGFERRIYIYINMGIGSWFLLWLKSDRSFECDQTIYIYIFLITACLLIFVKVKCEVSLGSRKIWICMQYCILRVHYCFAVGVLYIYKLVMTETVSLSSFSLCGSETFSLL